MFCSRKIKAQFFFSVLGGLVTGAIAGVAAATTSESNGITGSSEVVIAVVAAAIGAMTPAAIAAFTGYFKATPPVTIDLRAGLALAGGGAAGLGMYQAATALGASYPWASLMGAVGGTLTAVAAGVCLHKCGTAGTGAEAPLIDVTDGATA